MSNYLFHVKELKPKLIFVLNSFMRSQEGFPFCNLSQYRNRVLLLVYFLETIPFSSPIFSLSFRSFSFLLSSWPSFTFTLNIEEINYSIHSFEYSIAHHHLTFKASVKPSCRGGNDHKQQPNENKDENSRELILQKIQFMESINIHSMSGTRIRLNVLNKWKIDKCRIYLQLFTKSSVCLPFTQNFTLFFLIKHPQVINRVRMPVTIKKKNLLFGTVMLLVFSRCKIQVMTILLALILKSLVQFI